MHSLYRQIAQLCRTNQPGALCTVINTRGSTPQDAGCQMLVLPNAKTVGTIGGGCVEAEVRKRALRVVDVGQSELMQFLLDHDYGWDDGLICGGRMEIFVDVLNRPDVAEIYEELLNHVEAKKPVTIGTVVSSDSALTGQKFLYLNDEDRIIGSELFAFSEEIREAARGLVKTGRTGIFDFKSEQNEEVFQVFLEPVLPNPVLVIAGGGHVGQALAHQAGLIDFEVVVVDDRETMVSEDRFPDAAQRIAADIPKTLKDIPIDENTYVVIVTRGHLHDMDALHAVIERQAAYLGLIGSRRKIKMIFDEFCRLGIAEEKMRRVFAPIGLDIRSQTVPEIAMSIAAQLILVRRSRIDGIDVSEEQIVQSLRDRIRPLDPRR